MKTLSIAKREFRSYFNSPAAYIVICFTLVALGMLFFFGGFWDKNKASLQDMFVWLPRALSLIVVPVITMGLVAEEKRSGTLEMLITLPIKDRDVILGKFLGAWGVVMLLLSATFLYPIVLFKVFELGAVDFGPIITGYLGMTVYAAAAVAIGLMISSLTETQIVAAFLTFLVLGVMHFIAAGANAMGLPDTAAFVAAFVSFDARLGSFARGLLNTRDVLYFVTIAAGCLLTSSWALERRKWA